MFLNVIKDAILDETRTYRYMLKRQWGEDNNNFVNFVLLNPSTANEERDDPTVMACIALAQNMGFDGLYITNLFALRTKNPDTLKQNKNPIGDKNDTFIKRYALKSKRIIIAWGNHGEFLRRGEKVIHIISQIQVPYCFEITKKGNPRHPLYIKRSTHPFPWR